MAPLPDHPITRDHPISRSPAGPITRSLEIVRYYAALYSRWGSQNWWPARSRLEAIVAAYLTQNTNWSNVERAIANLRTGARRTLSGLPSIPFIPPRTPRRPSGSFRQH